MVEFSNFVSYYILYNLYIQLILVTDMTTHAVAQPLERRRQFSLQITYFSIRGVFFIL